jgi:hypothetical protein
MKHTVTVTVKHATVSGSPGARAFYAFYAFYALGVLFSVFGRQHAKKDLSVGYRVWQRVSEDMGGQFNFGA